MNMIDADILSVDFSEPKYIRLNVKQGDNGIRHFLFKCTNHGLPVSIDQSTIYAVLKLRKPDGTYVIKNCDILQDGSIDLIIDETITIVAGACQAELTLFEKNEIQDKTSVDEEKPTNTISTMNIVVNVFPSSIDGVELESKDEFSALNDLVSKMLRDYRFITDECNGIIRSVKTINGNAPDENGEYTLQKDDFKVVIDILNTTIEDVNKAIEARLPLSGGKMSGDIDMDGNQVLNLINPVVDGNAANKKYVDDSFSKCEELYMPLAGGEISGDINMGGSKVSGLPTPENDDEAANKSYVDTCVSDAVKPYLQKSGGTMTGDIDMNGNAISNLKNPQSLKDAVPKWYVDIKRHTFTAVLGMDWVGSGPYTQTLEVDGIMNTDMPHITPVYRSDESDTDEIVNRRIEQWSRVSYAEAVTNGILFTCMEEPAFDYLLRVQIEVMR